MSYESHNTVHGKYAVVSIWKTDKPQHTTFDEKALKEGGLADAVGKILAGKSVPTALLEAAMEGKMEDSKPMVASKLNWTGLAIVLVGLLPSISDSIAQVLPPEKAAPICGALGIGVMILRTFFTNKSVAGVVRQQ